MWSVNHVFGAAFSAVLSEAWQAVQVVAAADGDDDEKGLGDGFKTITYYCKKRVQRVPWTRLR